jgi:phage tail sheath gpL-like
MPSPDIQFYQIPSGIRKPGAYFEFNTLLAVNSLPANVYSVMIVAQMLPSGTAAPLTPTQVFSSAQAAAYFGEGSQAHRMVISALTANPTLTLYVCGMPDAAVGNPLAASGTLTLAGAPTNSGVLTLYVDNEMLQVGISPSDTPTTIAANLMAELETMPDLPVSYTVAAGVVTFNALNKGTVGNTINLNASVTAPGVTAVATAMTGGAVDPSLAAAFAACFPGNYSIYAVPYIDETNLQALRTQVEGVSAYNQQRGAIGVYGFTGSLAAATTLASEINDGRMLGAYLPGTYSAPFEVAAAMAAMIASSTDPAMPLNTLELLGINVPPLADQLTGTEVESLLWNGVTPLCVDADQNVAIVRAISTYTTNSSGIADPSLLDITTIRSLDYVRLACRTMFLLRFPRAKLVAAGPTTSGTAAQVRSMLLATLLQLESLEIVENVEANAAGLIVEQDSQSVTQLDAKIPAAVVPGLHVFAARIDLLLQ